MTAISSKKAEKQLEREIARKKRKLQKTTAFDVFNIIFLLILALIVIVPFYYTIVRSFLTQQEFIMNGTTLWLKWREDYYVGEGIKDAAKARKRIDAGRMAFGVYLVTLSENPGNLLEIVPSYMLIQKSYYARCPEIVGMAKGKDEAIDLAVDIVKNIYGETGAFQVKEYFKNR